MSKDNSSTIDEIFDLVKENEDEFYDVFFKDFNPEEVEDFARQYVDEEGPDVDPSKEEIRNAFREYRIGRGNYPPSEEDMERQEDSLTQPSPVDPNREETCVDDFEGSKEYIGLLVGIHEDGEEFEGEDTSEVDRSVIAYGPEFEEFVGGGFVPAEILKDDREDSRRTSLLDVEDSLTPEEERMARNASHIYGVKTEEEDYGSQSPPVQQVVNRFLEDYGNKNPLDHLRNRGHDIGF